MIWNKGFIIEGALSSYPRSSTKGWIYEVVRVIEGIPVFLPEHLERFWKACHATGIPLLYTEKELIKGFFDVIRENDITLGNLRLQAELGSGNVQIGIIPHHYPSVDDFKKGVDVELVNLQRTNPNIKTWNKNVRKFSDKFIRKNNIYEVILTTDEGFLLEGSRSNIFGLKKGVLITPPGEKVLPGITRQVIKDLASENNIQLREELIHKNDLCDFQSFFLTGTSPGILPIRSIGSIHFNYKSSICINLRESYEKEVIKSVKRTNQKLRP